MRITRSVLPLLVATGLGLSLLPLAPRQAEAQSTDLSILVAHVSVADGVDRRFGERIADRIRDALEDFAGYAALEEGVYHEGTRYLSKCILRMGDERPSLLSSTVKSKNEVLTIDLTNPDIRTEDGADIPRGTVHIFRSKFLWKGTCYERIRLLNYDEKPIDLPLHLELDADYVDIFEVRGMKREKTK